MTLKVTEEIEDNWFLVQN